MKQSHFLILSTCFVLLVLASFTGEKPKILIIGDSISLGYTPFVKEILEEKAIVTHNKGNARHSGYGLEQLEGWIQEDDFDIIQFNWGLHDLCYRHPDSKVYGNRDKINGDLTFTLKEYKENLEAILKILKEKSDAKLIFVTTSYVPKEEAGRFEKDAIKYNRVATRIMKRNNILVNDIYEKSKSIHEDHGLGNDDVHYKESGNVEMAKVIAPFLEKEL